MSKIWVRGYRKRDGTWVRGHFRGVAAKRTAIGFVSVSVAVAGVSVAVAAGGGGAAGGARPAPRPPTNQQVTARVKAEADFKRIVARVRPKGYTANVRAAQDTDCAAHSYGTVQDFFESSPCDLLSRAVVELRDKQRNVIIIAVSRVAMPDVTQAAKYKALVDRSGTGNVTELSREVGPYRRVRFTGDFYTSSITGVIVRNTQVQPVLGRPGRRALEELERSIK